MILVARKRGLHLDQDLLTDNMLTEEQILNKLKELFGRPKDLTVFLALTDRKDKPDITLPKNKNLV